MAEIRPILTGLLLAGLFALVLITAGIRLADTNNINQSIGDDPALSSYKEQLNANLDEAIVNANSSEAALGDSPVTLTSGVLVFDAIGGIWKTLKIVPVAVYSLTIGVLMEKVFGAEAFTVVFGILGAIIIMIIIFGVIKMVTSGEAG